MRSGVPAAETRQISGAPQGMRGVLGRSGAVLLVGLLLAASGCASWLPGERPGAGPALPPPSGGSGRATNPGWGVVKW